MRNAVSFLFGIGVSAALAASPAAASHRRWREVSNVGRDLMVAAALGVPAVQGDWTGDVQAGGSMLLGAGAAYGLKQIIREERPDHSDNKSFPSAHTAEAFAAAATLENRYGWEAGLPALAVATLVGVARVEARKHHWYDAVAGAAIGAGSGFLVTSARRDTVRLVPWADVGGGGLAVAARF